MNNSKKYANKENSTSTPYKKVAKSNFNANTTTPDSIMQYIN